MTAGTLDTTTADAGTATSAAGAAAATSVAAAGTTATTTTGTTTVTVPEKYALTLPEGSLLGATALERATATAKALKVTSDTDAQALLTLAHEQAAEVVQTYEAARQPGGTVHAAMVTQYAADGLKHPQLGNNDPAAFERKQLEAGLVLNQFGQTGLAADIKARGYLTPNELLFLSAVHAAMQEQPLAGVGARTQPPPNLEIYPKGSIPLDTHTAKP